MTNTTTSTQDLKTRVTTQLGGQWPHTAQLNFPGLDAAPEEIAKVAAFEGITDKATYLAWVAQYRTLINDLEAHIRSLKAKRFDDSASTRENAQSQRCWYAQAATALIMARRLGKIWSADQAAKRFDTAA